MRKQSPIFSQRKDLQEIYRVVTKKSVLLIFLYGLAFSFFLEGEAWAQFAGGSGSRQAPFQITTLDELQEIANHPEQHFELLNNIDASATAEWNNGKGFLPIGTDSLPFTGTLNGNGHEISGLTINRPNQELVGLFGYANRAGIANINLTKAKIEGANDTGSLIGKMFGGVVRHSTISAQVEGRTHTGGLTGFNRGGKVEFVTVQASVNGRSYVGGVTGINRGRMYRVTFSGEVSATGHNLGGIAGSNYDGLISESVSEGLISGKTVSSAGGISGSNGGKIIESFSHANVKARSYVGGLVGNNHNGDISRSYATGSVDGFNLVGGLAGVNRQNGAILECYTTSKVKGVIDYGAFIGVNREPIQAGYWNKDTSRQSYAINTGTEEGITGLYTDEMAGHKSFENMSGFSFGYIWGYVKGEPPKHLWDIPYFMVSDFKADSNLISGDIANFEITVENAGSKPDTNDVILRREDGEIIDRFDNLVLNPDEQFMLYFSWQTALSDHGKFDLFIDIGDYRKPTQVNVSSIPDPVDAKDPYVLEEHIDLKPTFRWDPAFLAKTYDLQISEDENFTSLTREITDIDTTHVTLSKPLKHLTYYHWRVRGVNPDTTGPWGDISEFTTIIDKPASVVLKGPAADKKNASTRPVFSWSSAHRSEEYMLQIASDEDFESVIFDTSVVATDTTLAMERTLPQKKRLYWRMKSLNMGGESSWSEARSFIPLIPPPKESNVNTLDYTLEQNYPNPFNPVTYIRYAIPEPGRVHLEVLNMLGQTVATLVDNYKAAGWHTAVFDASDLSSGFYIYRIKAKNFEATKKLSLVK